MSSCADCANARMVDQLGGVKLVCCAEPPALRPIPQGQGMAFASMFPIVERTWWCASYAQDRIINGDTHA